MIHKQTQFTDMIPKISNLHENVNFHDLVGEHKLIKLRRMHFYCSD